MIGGTITIPVQVELKEPLGSRTLLDGSEIAAEKIMTNLGIN